MVLTETRIVELVDAVATASANSDAAWRELVEDLGEGIVPFFLDAFAVAKKWQGRTALVYHSVPYARVSPSAVELGIRALGDKSYMVRYRACGLLAYSLRTDAIPHLRPLLAHTDHRTVENAAAAIVAIESRNHHRFIDRSDSGNSFWGVNPGDLPNGR